jgi:transposase
VKALKSVYRKWNLLCDRFGLYGKEYVSIDGSKFKAVNAKDRNFTLPKLDDRLRRIDNNIDDYMIMLDRADESESDERIFTKAEIEEKIQDLLTRKETYQGYVHEIESSGKKQISLTDPEARLMKFHEGFDVGYNVQTAIDSESHMVAEFLVTDHATDHGLIEEVADSVRKEFNLETIEAVADKGYHDKADMVSCLENGIIPNVHPAHRGNAHTLQTNYEPMTITEERQKSKSPEDIKECLRAGVIPDIYESIIDDIEIVEERHFHRGILPVGDAELPETVEQLVVKAKEGFFVRDITRDRVYCPAENILRAKSVKKNGATRYYNKLACSVCKKKCTKSKWKEIDFMPGKTIIACKAFGKGQGAEKIVNRKVTIEKKVRFKFKPDQRKLDNRMCLSEHPFGTVKRWNDGSYLLLKGKEKATGELSLSFMIYNMKRAIKMIGMKELIASIG